MVATGLPIRPLDGVLRHSASNEPCRQKNQLPAQPTPMPGQFGRAGHVCHCRRWAAVFVALLIAAFLLAMAAPARSAEMPVRSAGPVAITGADAIAVRESEDYEIVGLTIDEMGGSCTLYVLPDAAPVKVRLAQDMATKKPFLSVKATAPGVYTLVLDVNIPNRYTVAMKAVTVGGPQPNPQPGPWPQPTPGQQIAHVVVVEESSQRTPAQAKALTSAKVRQSLASKGIQWHLLDKDQTAQPWAAAYVRLAGAQLPRCIVVDSDDRVVEQFALPSESDLLAWVSKQKGAKP